jgi:hypothetical protein
MKPPNFIVVLTAVSLTAVMFICGGCEQTSGKWDDIGVFWKRTWGKGAAGQYSVIGLYRLTPQGLMHGPEVGGSSIEIERFEDNGVAHFKIKGSDGSAVIRLTNIHDSHLSPFKIVTTGLECFYYWEGKNEVFDTKKFLQMDPEFRP